MQSGSGEVTTKSQMQLRSSGESLANGEESMSSEKDSKERVVMMSDQRRCMKLRGGVKS